MQVKAITIKQPYATLIALGIKKFETRTWKTNYRGHLIIHAGKAQIQGKASVACHNFELETGLKRADYPLGIVTAIVNLADTWEMTEDSVKQGRETLCGDWKIGNYAWELRDVKSLLNWSISAKGQQGLWNPSKELLDAIF